MIPRTEGEAARRSRPSRALRRGSAIAAAGALALLVGCAPPTTTIDVPASSPLAEVAHVHRARCGSCHHRVEPGEKTRAQLEVAFTRHRVRVHLTEEQWGQMIDYLAAK